MKQISSSIVRFFRDDEAATAVEYSLLAALIAAVVYVGAQTLGTTVRDTMNTVAGNVAVGH